MLNALTSPTFSGSYYSVISRGQAHAVCNAAGENRSTKAQADTKLPNTGVVCGSLDNTRPDGTPDSDAGLVG